MILPAFLALFLPFAGMSAMFLVYVFLLWHAASTEAPEAVKAHKSKGLSKEELQKLPTITGKDLLLGTDCAVCLDEIEDDQPATLIPGCNHGFHVECAHAWLAKSSVCPVCRNNLHPELFAASEQNPC